jgi:hypothetical protein
MAEAGAAAGFIILPLPTAASAESLKHWNCLCHGYGASKCAVAPNLTINRNKYHIE